MNIAKIAAIVILLKQIRLHSGIDRPINGDWSASMEQVSPQAYIPAQAHIQELILMVSAAAMSVCRQWQHQSKRKQSIECCM